MKNIILLFVLILLTAVVISSADTTDKNSSLEPLSKINKLSTREGSAALSKGARALNLSGSSISGEIKGQIELPLIKRKRKFLNKKDDIIEFKKGAEEEG